MNMRSLLAATLVMSSGIVAAQADDIVVDASQIASQAVGSKGANCPSFSMESESDSNKVLWTVEASPEKSFDFGKLEIPLEIDITPKAVVTLDADVELADQSYLEIGLQMQDGRYFFANVKASEATPGRSYAFPVAEMASADGKPFTGEPARSAGITLMVNSDASDAAGVSKTRIERVVVSP